MQSILSSKNGGRNLEKKSLTSLKLKRQTVHQPPAKRAPMPIKTGYSAVLRSYEKKRQSKVKSPGIGIGEHYGLQQNRDGQVRFNNEV